MLEARAAVVVRQARWEWCAYTSFWQMDWSRCFSLPKFRLMHPSSHQISCALKRSIWISPILPINLHMQALWCQLGGWEHWFSSYLPGDSHWLTQNWLQHFSAGWHRLYTHLYFPVSSQFHAIRTDRIKSLDWIYTEISFFPPPRKRIVKKGVQKLFQHRYTADFDSSFSTSNWFQGFFPNWLSYCHYALVSWTFYLEGKMQEKSFHLKKRKIKIQNNGFAGTDVIRLNFN